MRSREIVLMGGGLPSLPHQAPHAPVPAYARAAALTLAERQVVGLARCGLSNEEAAALRGASKSTVANQLSTAYKKLGITGRRELNALLTEPLPEAQAPVSRLTAREEQVLAYARQGLSNKFIAGSLGITISTVSTTLTRARRKLGSSGAS